MTLEPLLPCVADAKLRWGNQQLSLASQFVAPARRSKWLDLSTSPLQRVPSSDTVESESGEEAASPPSKPVAAEPTVVRKSRDMVGRKGTPRFIGALNTQWILFQN